VSDIMENVLMTHVNLHNSFGGIGISGIICAMLARYVFDSNSIFTFKLIPVTGYEFLILSVTFDIFFFFTGLLPEIGHASHLAGLIFGLFFWKISERIWTFREFLGKKLRISKS
jgi:membrane associated rhomboid family serine protease